MLVRASLGPLKAFRDLLLGFEAGKISHRSRRHRLPFSPLVSHVHARWPTPRDEDDRGENQSLLLGHITKRAMPRKKPPQEAASGPPLSWDDPVDVAPQQDVLRSSFYSVATDVSEKMMLERETRETPYVEIGTPYADLITHTFKFTCALVLLAVQTFSVHRDMWPAKTMAVVRHPDFATSVSRPPPAFLTPGTSSGRCGTRSQSS